MYIKQSDLLLGTSMDFVKQFMDLSEMESCKKGEILFRENDPARYFYTLLSGRVKLSISEGGHTVHDTKQNGEAFGWSSLIDRNVYSASAECIEPTTLLITDSKKLTQLLIKDPANGLIFFRQLAATLGNRLLESYEQLTQKP